MARQRIDYKRMFIVSTCLFIVLFLILFKREIDNAVSMAKYDSIISFDLHPFWKRAAK